MSLFCNSIKTSGCGCDDLVVKPASPLFDNPYRRCSSKRKGLGLFCEQLVPHAEYTAIRFTPAKKSHDNPRELLCLL